MRGYRYREERSDDVGEPMVAPRREGGQKVNPWMDVELIADEVAPADTWLFIQGGARQGTTATWKLLNAHEDVTLCCEGWVLGWAERALTSYQHRGPGTQFAVARQIEAAGGLGEDGVLRIKASQVRSIMEGVRDAFSGGASRFGDKRGGYRRAASLELLDTVLPEHRTVAVVRSTWATADSLYRWWYGRSQYRDLTDYELAAKALEKAKSDHAEMNALIEERDWFCFRFDQAATDLRSAVRRMLVHLDLPFSGYDWSILGHVHFDESVDRWRDNAHLVDMFAERE